MCVDLYQKYPKRNKLIQLGSKPVVCCYNILDWVFQQAQIAVNMIEYVLSLAENTLMTLISRKPRNRREGV